MFPLFLELWANKERNKNQKTAERLHQCGFTSMHYTFQRVKYCEGRNFKVNNQKTVLRSPLRPKRK